MGRFSTVRDVFRHLVSDSPSISKTVAHGRRELLRDEGGNSLFAWPALAVARRIKGRAAVDDWLYQHLHRPLKNLDEKGGRLFADAFHAPNLFRHVDVLPTASSIDAKKALIEHVTHSATAPIGKAGRLVTPIAASLYVADALNGAGGEEKMANAEQVEDKNALLKEASEHLRKAHRRLEAEKLAFDLVEKGKVPAFASYESFQEKVAELLAKDLAVVKEALSMDGPIADFGKVAEDKRAGADEATAAFYHTLAD